MEEMQRNLRQDSFLQTVYNKLRERKVAWVKYLHAVMTVKTI